ncbi:hypothetical protein [Gryllotalpicola ginsengisoli]|nr:hypothetical protein [Gryllotalpicola ginsengisoli]
MASSPLPRRATNRDVARLAGVNYAADAACNTATATATVTVVK